MTALDLSQITLRELNQRLQGVAAGSNELDFTVTNPEGAHSIAVGLTQPIRVTVDGHTGFYCGGMNQKAEILVKGHVGPGVGENMMSGRIHVTGNASQAAGATGQGGLLVIEGSTSSRCGISMKGIDIVVGGSVGHMSAFMAQSGALVVCGDAGASLGDSIYEARLYVAGAVESLGSDCVEKQMTAHHKEKLQRLLDAAKIKADVKRFRRYGSARKLYNFHVDNADAY
jgi:glutamate synthase domain-containing protein 3